MTDHEWQDYAAPYALGALAPDERSAFEGHLAGCDVCRAELRTFAEVAGLLAHTAPIAEPPPGLRDRVLAEARRVRPIAARQAPAAGRPSGLRVAWLAAAAAVLLAVAAGIQALRMSSRLRMVEKALALSDSIRRVDSATLAELTGPQVDIVSLAATGRQPSARVIWNRAKGRFVVMAFDLPAAPNGRTYQLWAIAAGKSPLSMGTFNTDASGHATAVLPVDPQITALGFIDNCGLTEEPAGGSPQPTETPRLLGAWRRTD